MIEVLVSQYHMRHVASGELATSSRIACASVSVSGVDQQSPVLPCTNRQ